MADLTQAQQLMIAALRDRLEKSLDHVRPPENGIGRIIEEEVPLRDGVKLYTKGVLPEGRGPWPVTFQRSCYAMQAEMLDWMARQMALRGYASGFQMCRGTGGSGGEWRPFVNERRDGEDTLAWICAQPWAGDIGLYGASCLGFTQWMVADILPSRVKTMVITQAGIDRYHANYSNGMFRHDVYTFWAQMNAGRPVDPALYPGCCLHRPHLTVDEDLWGIRLDWYRDWISHSDFSDPYWNREEWKTLRDAAADIRVPVCLVGGWYDHHLEGMFYAYSRLREDVRRESRFVIGPWNHGLGNCVDAYPLPGSDTSGPEAFAETLRWMDGIFPARSGPSRPKPETGLAAYVIGEGRWKTYGSWPPPGIRYREFHLGAGEGGAAGLVEGNAGHGSLSYTYDPSRPPVEAIGAESMMAAPPEKRGSRLQPPPAFRDDVLSFLSEPLEEDLSLSGQSRVSLFVSSTAPDTAFAVKLMEVFPDGGAYNIRSGISSISYRNDAPHRLPYEGATVVELGIPLWPITWRLHKGSRLRLDLMSTLFPEFHVHPNTGEPWARARETRIARQTIMTGEDYPSRLSIAVESP